MTGPAPIGDWELVSAVALVAVAGGVSFVLGLDLERRLAWATARAVVQLFLIGHVLYFVLETPNPFFIFLMMTIMTVAAAHQAVQRPERTLPGASVGAFVTLALVGIITTSTVTGGLLHLSPWYAPRHALPLLGMILGNTLNGLSLSLDNLLESVDLRRGEIEAELGLGATRVEALRRPLARAVRIGMTPIINATSVVGLVSLPGMMTGQILAGTDPRTAVRYQLLVMFMVVGATAVGCLALNLYAAARLTDREHRLRPQ